jgi:hypothetical protein
MTPANALQSLGLSLFGDSMPIFSPEWADTGANNPTFDLPTMSLNLATPDWLSPCAGVLTPIEAGKSQAVTLSAADGTPFNEDGALLTLFEQPRLRLARLYSQALEVTGSANPGFANGHPVRPVPAYFFFSQIFQPVQAGKVSPGERLEFSGSMTVHDTDGLPIDPVATAAIFSALMIVHPLLQHLASGSSPSTVFQLQQIATSAGSSAVVARLVDADGQPHNGSRFSGITAIHAATGQFTLDTPAAGSNALEGSILKETASTAFPEETRRLLKIGAATTGRLTDGPLNFPATGLATPLARDFFSVRVAKLDQILLGEPDAEFMGTKIENPPSIRTNEALRLLTDGNDILAGCARALSNASGESLAVAQAIDGRFPLPSDFGISSRWPAFPAATGSPAAAGNLPIRLIDDISPEAHYFDNGDSQAANIDVVLTLSGLPGESAIRIYTRNFAADATEERGDGAGAVVGASGDITLRLFDPLSLRTPGLQDNEINIPAAANLRFDLMVVKRTGETRLYGDVVVPIDFASTTAPPQQGQNTAGLAIRRGVSNAGVLGLGTTGPLPSDPRDAVLALAGEGNPRDAPRFPTMARRDLIVAGIDGGGIPTATLSGGRLDREMHSADPRLGAPGSLGGRESQAAAVFSTGGRLAMDMARMALRRTTHLIERLPALADSQWNEPDQRPEPAVNTAAGPDVGTFSAAMLQTIAPFCEAPELQPLSVLLNLENLPQTFDQLVDAVVNVLPGSTPRRSDLVSMLNNLKNSSLDESVVERLYSEAQRDIASAAQGRRDTQWALEGAINRARQCIYIESPGFSYTAPKPTDPPAEPDPNKPYIRDLLDALDKQVIKMPGLRVIICTPKHPDFGPGYEPFAASEAHDRKESILKLHTADDENPTQSRIVAFHPIGFPGRPSRIETMTVIVDDVWALTGSSSFRRRGLTFDGGSDIAIYDSDVREHVSPAIQAYRRQLMANRLGIAATDSDGFRDADFARLADRNEAAHVVRDRLRGGGQGKIARLWSGQTPGVDQLDPNSIPQLLVNPEGMEIDVVALLGIVGIASLGRF